MARGHGPAGVGLARCLGLLCPVLLLSLLALRAFLPLPAPLRWLWAGSMLACALSAAVALILLLFGPWQNRIAGTAQRLFTHRHTIRYRLERVKDLTGLDCSSTDGRERLSLGLKSMRVLGIANPGGPANEAGAEGGRVAPAGK